MFDGATIVFVYVLGVVKIRLWYIYMYVHALIWRFFRIVGMTNCHFFEHIYGIITPMKGKCRCGACLLSCLSLADWVLVYFHIIMWNVTIVNICVLCLLLSIIYCVRWMSRMCGQLFVTIYVWWCNNCVCLCIGYCENMAMVHIFVCAYPNMTCFSYCRYD